MRLHRLPDLAHLIERFRVSPGRRVSLARHDPRDTAGITSRAVAERLLAENLEELRRQQEILYAQDLYAVLVIVQALDAAGKDGVIQHVMSGVNPHGTDVHSFKAPSAHELDHDYLWRSVKALPPKGIIGIHNRSHYEEVIVTRVHSEILSRQKLPPGPRDDRFWRRRFEEINDFERFLLANGTVVLKFFLHVSKDEQRRRFLKRIERPEKNWKFSLGDVRKRAQWDAYMRAYEDALTHTSTARAPWYIVPADKKWFTRLVVGAAITAALQRLKLAYPPLTAARRAELQEARRLLEREK